MALILSRDKQDVSEIRERLHSEGCIATLRICCAEELLAYLKLFSLDDHEILVAAGEYEYWKPHLPAERFPLVEIW